MISRIAVDRTNKLSNNKILRSSNNQEHDSINSNMRIFSQYIQYNTDKIT
jgi:hypothetical protein